jgi:stalled ribosome rescue protein Dom34
MKKRVGLWIDHTEARLVWIDGDAVETQHIESHVSRHDGKVGAEDRRDHRFKLDLDAFYDAVITQLTEAEQILLIGPGEAKGEFQKRLAKTNMDTRVVRVEVADKMTEREIIAKVTHYFEHRTPM